MKKSQLYKGILIMLLSSLLTCTGQLCWKLSGSRSAVTFILIGFILYGCGAALMIIALRYGDLSTLHPMLGVGYVLAIALGAVVLNEPISPRKLLGIATIIFGLVLISMPERSK
ncbi:multidrug efflux SMR transporter [uncultured Oscillibacter sp.]|uniref:DMT family transporter n=1 Tax=uncultured Oscillibacter sp. TaxID=876091 RepID=UPI0025E2B41E|nr:EamA family transporter [uncultured Oscillibacter sp.]